MGFLTFRHQSGKFAALEARGAQHSLGSLGHFVNCRLPKPEVPLGFLRRKESCLLQEGGQMHAIMPLSRSYVTKVKLIVT